MEMKIYHIQDSQGFTLIELMMVIVIMGVLFSLGVVYFSNFNKTQTIKGVGQTLKGNLRDIQGKALAGVKPTTASCQAVGVTLDGYRVTILNNFTYRIQAVCSGSLNADLTDYTLPSGFSITAPAQSVYFDFKVLGNGISFSDATTSKIMTVQGYQNPIYYYSLCLSAGGDIKDCGYNKNSAPLCTCP